MGFSHKQRPFSPTPLLVFMARTTQTARRSTGGRAARVSNEVLQMGDSDQPKNERASSESASSVDAQEQSQVSKPSSSIHLIGLCFFQTWCYLCLNGGMLFLCDRCPHVVCSDHISLPEGSNTSGTVFICIACHIAAFEDPTPYFVSSLYSLFSFTGC